MDGDGTHVTSRCSARWWPSPTRWARPATTAFIEACRHPDGASRSSGWRSSSSSAGPCDRGRAGSPPTARIPSAAWVVLFAAIVLWELADYAARGSRADHPTLSSMLDAVDRFFVLKTLLFFAWLCLGAAILRKGTPRTSTSAPEPAPRQEPTPSP